MQDQMAYVFQIVIEEAIMDKNAQTIKRQKYSAAEKIQHWASHSSIRQPNVMVEDCLFRDLVQLRTRIVRIKLVKSELLTSGACALSNMKSW